MSQRFRNQCSIKSSDSSVNCVDYDQLCVVSYSVCDRDNNKLIFNDIHNNGNVCTCIDNKGAFNTVFDKCIPSDTISDLLYKVYDSHLYQPQRQTIAPCYAYCVAPLQVNYLMYWSISIETHW